MNLHCIDPLGNFTHGNDRNQFHRLGIDGRDRPQARVGDINQPAVGREGHPIGHRGNIAVVRQLKAWQGHLADQLEIIKRIDIDRIVGNAGHPQRLAIGRTPIPCDGKSARPASVSNADGGSGRVMRATSLRRAKSTTANPLRSES